MKILWIILGVLGALAVLRCLSLACSGRRDWKALQGAVYAHRGLHQKPEIPENSLMAFYRAVEHGFGAELDVHLMKDGNLAVIHDSSLQRTAGVPVRIEDLTLEDLKRYPLEESGEYIPLLSQVLPIFEGKAPLIIEIKAAGGNTAALCQRLAEQLDRYRGDYCVESFHPSAVLWFRRHRPQVCRGQLAENFVESGDSTLPYLVKLAGTHMIGNFLTRPDFIAYRYEHRNIGSLRLCRRLWRPMEASWTIRTQQDLEQAQKEGKLPIFEKFIPRGGLKPPAKADIIETK